MDIINLPFIKNLSSSTSHKKNVKLWDFSFYLSSTFIHEPILIKIYMNANIINAQTFNFNEYDLKGH